MKTLLSVFVVVALLFSITSLTSQANEDPIKRSLRTRGHGIAILLGARDKGGVTSGGGGSGSEAIERCIHLIAQSGPVNEPDAFVTCGMTKASAFCAMILIQRGQPSSEAAKCVADPTYYNVSE